MHHEEKERTGSARTCSRSCLPKKQDVRRRGMRSRHLDERNARCRGRVSRHLRASQVAEVAMRCFRYVLGYKGKWGPLSQPHKLGDGPDLWLTPSTVFYIQFCGNDRAHGARLSWQHSLSRQPIFQNKQSTRPPLHNSSTAYCLFFFLVHLYIP